MFNIHFNILTGFVVCCAVGITKQKGWNCVGLFYITLRCRDTSSDKCGRFVSSKNAYSFTQITQTHIIIHYLAYEIICWHDGRDYYY